MPTNVTEVSNLLPQAGGVAANSTDITCSRGGTCPHATTEVRSIRPSLFGKDTIKDVAIVPNGSTTCSTCTK